MIIDLFASNVVDQLREFGFVTGLIALKAGRQGAEGQTEIAQAISESLDAMAARFEALPNDERDAQLAGWAKAYLAATANYQKADLRPDQMERTRKARLQAENFLQMV